MNAELSVGELLPCPWCGQTPQRDGIGRDGEYAEWVACAQIDCPVQPQTIPFPWADEAIAAWNTRRPAPEGKGSE